ncbi:MAG TPA: flagellar biosynthetic protein FliQ [Blastocatellia bacterium]|nr:flagellar biosynthetic protein FliQ [Blastocatellia bacterium]
MYDATVLELAKKTLEMVLYLSGPLLLIAIVIGVVISLIQTITSIQDSTLAFAPRVVGMFILFGFIFSWMMRMMVTYTHDLFQDFNRYIR